MWGVVFLFLSRKVKEKPAACRGIGMQDGRKEGRRGDGDRWWEGFGKKGREGRKGMDGKKKVMAGCWYFTSATCGA
jgi:hypothetical protein